MLMRSAAPVLDPAYATPPSPRQPPRLGGRPPSDFQFNSLVLTDAESLAKGRSTTLAFSAILHSILIAALILIPLFATDRLPVPDTALHAFFAAPVDVAPPPPPPPPPPAGARAATRAPAAPRPAEPPKFVAPVEVPVEIKPDIMGVDLGVPGGVVGGVEGGVPGGVVGGIIGGLPQEPPATKVVRIGGSVTPPKLVRRVPPIFPRLALTARVRAIVILEAQVDVHGAVKRVAVVQGHPLFNDEAIAAVNQWRYQPLLLNGEPVEFILSVTVNFNLREPTEVGVQ
jgi:protein TonB